MYTTFGATQQIISTTKAYGLAHKRRCANYKPSIWNYDFIQSLKSEFTEAVYMTQAKILKEMFIVFLSEELELSRLHITDSISKLGLSNVLPKLMKDALDSIASNPNDTAGFNEDIQKTALRFRLLRQHGYNVSQDVFIGFIDEKVPFKEMIGPDLSGVLELFEASHLAVEGEEILANAKVLSYQNLIDRYQYLDVDRAQQVAHALNGPCHWRVLWFDVRHHIHAYEQQNDNNKILLKLAKLNFNITQAIIIEELKEMSRWLKNLGLIDDIKFSRDRLVETFSWTVGIAFEPQHSLLRKCLTKVVTLVLVLDDLYDIYGSLEELKYFTRAVERWDSQELQQLPKCINICFETLRKTTAEIANEIQKDKGWDDISCYLKTAWADFCKALLSEARWYNANHIPSLEGYLKSAWISSSGPLLSLVTVLCSAEGGPDVLNDKLRESQDLIYCISLIVRLSNDLGTSAAELERGDSPSSILCNMVEANVTEEIAREHIKKMIVNAWKKINRELLLASSERQTHVNQIVNIARVCQFIYHEGDGFGAPNKNIRKQIEGVLIEPIQLSRD
ncbi:(E,E)-alpha-farnesene synthase-like [Silene latifolia]|uniref:(E,E)-alpha-farnesene synthase-like n=1 Tax=Silene latifolia TaxID=37657 RepID=UPI003D76CC48